MIQEIKDVLNGTYKRRARNNAAAGVGAGVLLGAIAGLLFAPKAGKETRADLVEGAKIGAEKVKETAVHVADVTKEKFEEVKQQVKKSTKKTAATVEEAMEDVQEAVEDIDTAR